MPDADQVHVLAARGRQLPRGRGRGARREERLGRAARGGRGPRGAGPGARPRVRAGPANLESRSSSMSNLASILKLAQQILGIYAEHSDFRRLYVIYCGNRSNRLSCHIPAFSLRLLLSSPRKKEIKSSPQKKNPAEHETLQRKRSHCGPRRGGGRVDGRGGAEHARLLRLERPGGARRRLQPRPEDRARFGAAYGLGRPGDRVRRLDLSLV